MPTPTPPSTRDRILAYLAEHPSASAADLSQAWRLTRADIRYHLAALLDDGLIEPAPRPAGQPTGRGRPARSYRLATQARPSNLPALCSALLIHLLAGLDPAQHEEALRSIAPTLATALAGSQPPAANLTRRLTQLVEQLNHAHYRARWEAGAQGPRILLRACPYAAILDQHPELCRLDQAVLEQLLQARLRQSARINPTTGSPAACVFIVT